MQVTAADEAGEDSEDELAVEVAVVLRRLGLPIDRRQATDQIGGTAGAFLDRKLCSLIIGG